jgi:thioredoxin reductase (NADPH)
MTSWLLPFPIERPEATFPALTDEQLQAIEPYGQDVELPADTVLYRRGDRDIDFFVILEGEAEAFGVDRYGNEQVYVRHTAGSFTGELNLFSNSRSLVSARAVTPLRVLRVKRQQLRRLTTAQPEIGELLLRAFVLRRENFLRVGRGGILLIGHAEDPDTLRVRQFLTRNGYPYEFVDADATDERGSTATTCLSLKADDLPAIWDGKQLVLKQPSLLQLSQSLGLLDEPPSARVFDLAIVGAGPAGLAASVYASSEGLDTLLIDTFGPGGQAGTSSRIENYLGFPNGLSGQELASRAEVQAVKFGVHFSLARAVTGIRRTPSCFELELSEGARFRARAVIVASGANYRKLDLPDSTRFDGRGVYYAATAMEAELCRGSEVVVVGGGNSAGQAAAYLSKTCSKVIMLVRGRNLSASMSAYLIERITASPRIELYFESEITSLKGTRELEVVEWERVGQSRPTTSPIRTVFVMIGAIPCTEWLRGCVELDGNGFVITGRSASGAVLGSPFETTQPGVFAVGNVRAGSVKRVASAVGEGSVVLQWVHQYLAASPHSQREQHAA